MVWYPKANVFCVGEASEVCVQLQHLSCMWWKKECPRSRKCAKTNKNTKKWHNRQEIIKELIRIKFGSAFVLHISLLKCIATIIITIAATKTNATVGKTITIRWQWSCCSSINNSSTCKNCCNHISYCRGSKYSNSTSKLALVTGSVIQIALTIHYCITIIVISIVFRNDNSNYCPHHISMNLYMEIIHNLWQPLILLINSNNNHRNKLLIHQSLPTIATTVHGCSNRNNSIISNYHHWNNQSTSRIQWGSSWQYRCSRHTQLLLKHHFHPNHVHSLLH